LKKNIIITGGCGFIGSNLVINILAQKPDWVVHNFDALTYAANREYLSDIEQHPNYHFYHLDITDQKALFDAVSKITPDGIFHLAAESHVDNSIAKPDTFIQTNIVGTYNLLEAWRNLTNSYLPINGVLPRFLHVSTDEVYGDLKIHDEAFSENSQYKPSSPYSASKAASDHLTRAWGRTYGLDIVITNCSNNFGPRQHSEKFIPTVINACLNRLPIPVYGKGENIRDWLFVEDHCSALIHVFEKGTSQETYLIGTRNELQNIILVNQICEMVDAKLGNNEQNSCKNLITFVQDRKGHDKRYSVNPSKLETELGWKPHKDFALGLKDTLDWYCKFNSL